MDWTVPAPRTVVVVGASLAGLRAVEALRRRGYDGTIVWIGAERHAPYDRPPLSKQILEGTFQPERLFFRRKEGYDSLDVTQVFGRRAVSLDTNARTIQLDDGRSISFDGLCIATGARARTLPGTDELPGVFVLRTLDDALGIRDALASSPRVAIVGGGFIGLEVASSCRKRGLSVTVCEMARTPLAPVLGETMGTAIANIHRDEGVTLKTGVTVAGVEGHGRAEAVRLTDGTRIEADLVVVGIGVVPETDFLTGSAVEVDDGILCDERCATSVPGIVAAGDVARWPNPLFGETMRIEHWTNAVEQAGHAVQRLLDGPESTPAFAPAPYVWSDQFDVKIQVAGRIRKTDEFTVAEGSPEERKMVGAYFRNGILVGAVAFNRPASLFKYRQLISKRAKKEELA